MADQEIRMGIRLLLSGGMPSLDSDTVQKLKKSCESVQRQRTPSALTEKDAEYLANYVEICDGFLTQTYTHGDALDRLSMLNEHYADSELAENVRKITIPGENLVDSSWVGSSMDC